MWAEIRVVFGFSAEKNLSNHGTAHKLLVVITWLDTLAAAQVLQQRQTIFAAKVNELDVLHVVIEEDACAGKTERSLAFIGVKIRKQRYQIYVI